MSDHLTTAREFLGFCIDEIVLSDLGESKVIKALLETADEMIKNLELAIVNHPYPRLQTLVTLARDVAKCENEMEKSGHFGYTSKDGEDFENQEVDRMCDDSKVPSDSDLLGW